MTPVLEDPIAQPAAYGFRYEGIDPTPLLGVCGVGEWPAISVTRTVAELPLGVDAEVSRMSEDHATAVTPAGVLRMDRRRATLSIASPTTLALSDVVHPGLWPAAAVFARWRGLETLHAGAFLDGDAGAWAVMAQSGAGKSSLLVTLALAGVEILVDDMVVIDGADGCAGPRCIDLRPEAARELGVTESTQPVRSTSRRRFGLEPCAASAPLRGFVELDWGDTVAVRRLAPSAALACLARHRRVLGLGAELDQLLDLAGLPTFRLSRPRDWSAQPGAARELMRVLRGT